VLLEAGGWDRDPWLTIPPAWGRILQRRMPDWMYFAEPEATLDGRGIECARGKVIGGSSSINAMAYVRGHRGDYDRWAETGFTRSARFERNPKIVPQNGSCRSIVCTVTARAAAEPVLQSCNST